MTKYSAFTSNYNGLSKVLSNQVGITDPAQNRLIGTKPNIQLNKIAIWDTGATNSAITEELAKELNLVTTGFVDVNHGGGTETRKTYLVDVWLPNGVAIQGVKVTELNLKGADVLIGMDIIGIGDFAISNFEGKTSFSFRVPSKRKTDYVVTENKHNKKASKPKKGKGKNKGRFKY